jgi:hypothetical protein
MKCSQEKLAGDTLLFACTSLLALPEDDARSAAEDYRVRYHWIRFPRSETRGFRHDLLELGYVRGQNIVTPCRSAHGRVGTLGRLVAERVRPNIDVVLAPYSRVTHAAMDASSAISTISNTILP